MTSELKTDDRAIFRFQIWTIFLVIVAMTPGLSAEPINPVKLAVLTVGTLSAVFVLTTSFSSLFFVLGNWALSLIGVLLAQIIFGSLTNMASLNKFVYGEWGRNTGLLFYFCLVLVFLTFALTYDERNVERIYRCLIGAGLLNTTYMCLQALDLDPVKWEIVQTFGFTGNLNFASSFVSVYAVLVFVWLIDKRGNVYIRGLLSISAVVALVIVFQSGSLQGLIQFLLGLIIFWIFKGIKSKRISLFAKLRGVFVTLIFFATTLLIVLTAFPKFLSGVFFQQTMGYRRDYWLAGIEMIKAKPFNGVGVDNYGNFYHAFRQESAAVDNFLRQSNSAHSIILDIGSNYGLLAALSYVFLLSYVFFCIVKSLNGGDETNLLTGLGSVWIALQIQNVIGINQATTGILTWSIGGFYVAHYHFCQHEEKPKIALESSRDSNQAKMKKSIAALTPSGLVKAISGAVIGTIMVMPLLYGDISFQNARDKQDFAKMSKVAKHSLIGNQTMMEFTVSDLVGKSLGNEGLAAARNLVQKYPRSVYGWRVIASLKATPEVERQKALREFKILDPFGFKYATQSVDNQK